jgi:hypothetical protein
MMSSPHASEAIKDYLAEKIEAQRKLGKTEDSIANEIGYQRPQTLHMITSGEMKLPLDKVLPLSRALNCEPAELFELALRQYMSAPEVDELCGSFDANARSGGVVHKRTVAGGKAPPLTPAERDDLERIVGSAGSAAGELAFNGTLEFDLNMELFGKTVQRKARVLWEYTPSWEHFDLHRGCVTKRPEHSAMKIEVLAFLEGEWLQFGDDGKLHEVEDGERYEWTRLDLLEAGVLPEEVWNEIDDRIDDICRKEDAGHRARFARASDKPRGASEEPG